MSKMQEASLSRLKIKLKINKIFNMDTKKIIKAASFTIFIYSLLGGLYILAVALVHPQTLSIQLSHLTPWIREDTFGIISWIVSFFSFLIWNLVREK